MSEPSKVVESAQEEGEEENGGKKPSNPHKYDSGAADLERVTDFVEEKELGFASDAAVSNLNLALAANAKRPVEKEAKIIIRKEDIELMVEELEVTKATAERKLREHRGNVKTAMKDILGF